MAVNKDMFHKNSGQEDATLYGGMGIGENIH